MTTVTLLTEVNSAAVKTHFYSLLVLAFSTAVGIFYNYGTCVKTVLNLPPVILFFPFHIAYIISFFLHTNTVSLLDYISPCVI